MIPNPFSKRINQRNRLFFYDPPFHLRSETSVQLNFEDENGLIDRGRIDGLIVQEYLWIVLIDSKRTSFSIEVALP
jgi:hypothetical protein